MFCETHNVRRENKLLDRPIVPLVLASSGCSIRPLPAVGIAGRHTRLSSPVLVSERQPQRRGGHTQAGLSNDP